MNLTFTENSRLIKEAKDIKSFLEDNGSCVKGKRAICPICKDKKYTMAIDEKTQRVSCYKGCTNQGRKQTADIIDLYGLINNRNSIESLNELINLYNINRYIGDYKGAKSKINHEFKVNAQKHLMEMHEKLYTLKLLKYDLLESTNNYYKCVGLIEKIDLYIDKLKSNNFNEAEGRHIYKECLTFYNFISNIDN